MAKHLYQITCVPKPRMTQSDKWKQRPPVMRYRAFADECRLLGIKIPESGAHITFIMPMPKSWSGKKRARMNGCPHQQVPDVDNLLKSCFDAIYSNDSIVWDCRVTKRWGVIGMICIETGNQTKIKLEDLS